MQPFKAEILQVFTLNMHKLNSQEILDREEKKKKRKKEREKDFCENILSLKKKF